MTGNAECETRNAERGTRNAGAQRADAAAGTPDASLRRGADIAERFVELAAFVVRLAQKLPRDAGSKHIAAQLVRSAASAGANYEEGRAAESRADFIHKLGIASKEIRETVYWLSLVERAGLAPGGVTPTLKASTREAAELAAILSASVRTARANTRPRT